MRLSELPLSAAVVISILGQESLLAVLDATKGINLDVDVVRIRNPAVSSLYELNWSMFTQGSATCTIHAFHDGYGAQIPTLNILAVQNIACRLMFKELNVFWAFVFFSSGPSLNRPLGVPDPNHNSVGFNLHELQTAHMAAPEFPYSNGSHNESAPDWSLGCALRVVTQDIENLCSFLRVKNMVEGWCLGASGVLGPFWQND